MLTDRQNNRLALVALFIGAAVMATVIANRTSPLALWPKRPRRADPLAL